MLRTEWRVVFHLGRYGSMTAKDICQRARLHKTKVSRAVVALEKKRFLTCWRSETDRRLEDLRLTKRGTAVFDDLCVHAREFYAKLVSGLSAIEIPTLRKCLLAIAKL